MKKTISIIVPIYNVEKYLSKCLDSLINQTYKDILIYAVIDGSPDNSISILKKYQKKDKRIVLIEKENGGYGSALQEAIKNIDSTYFMVCDPDDWLDINAVKKLASTAFKYNLDIVVADKYIVYKDNKETEIYRSDKYFSLIKPNKVYDDVGMFSMLSLSPHSKLYKTKLIKNLSFPKKVSYTDIILYLIAISNANKGMYIDVPLSYYLIDREGNTSTDKSNKAFLSEIEVLKYTFNHLNTNKEYIYVRLYEQFRYSLIEYYSYLSKKDKNKYRNKLSFILNLKRYKKSIIKYLKDNNSSKKNVIICHLLLNRITYLIIINLLAKKAKKNSFIN